MDFVTMLEAHLEWAEGKKSKPYRDTTGNLTIGVGRNLSGKGLSESEIRFLLANDVAEVLHVCRNLPYWNLLNDARRLVVADMMFNLGEAGFHTFKKFESALAHGLWDEAARQMRDSTWYHQVKRRARKLVAAMETGVWGSSSLH